MGVIIGIILILVTNWITWNFTWGRIRFSDRVKIGTMEQVVGDGSYDFGNLVLALERLSPKARATFAYLYVSSISKDKRLFGTVRRYIDMRAAGIVVPQKPKEKGL